MKKTYSTPSTDVIAIVPPALLTESDTDLTLPASPEEEDAANAASRSIIP
ncbi:MAG: hypothetical protein IJ551_00560 [Prevotella sp.]|nr:hypothetical protein [Prevotella sp.]